MVGGWCESMHSQPATRSNSRDYHLLSDFEEFAIALGVGRGIDGFVEYALVGRMGRLIIKSINAGRQGEHEAVGNPSIRAAFDANRK